MRLQSSVRSFIVIARQMFRNFLLDRVDAFELSEELRLANRNFFTQLSNSVAACFALQVFLLVNVELVHFVVDKAFQIFKSSLVLTTDHLRKSITSLCKTFVKLFQALVDSSELTAQICLNAVFDQLVLLVDKGIEGVELYLDEARV